ncbi:MAG: Asp23/Gls24 family envelope stress response protein [Candidatus Pacebacteria bacterium]|nr:Asp23/Gls24 family envelope stress response protein [Candidatus Paceibacterota bacterium]
MSDQKKKQSENKPQEAVPKSPPSMTAEMLTADETETGAIRISENVIAAVVRKYTLEVDGVVRFASASIVSGLAEMIGRKSQESSIMVELEGEAVNISVTLVLQFGVKVPEVAALVQDVISSRVEELTGKHVTAVNVVVQDLEDVVPEESEAEERQ